MSNAIKLSAGQKRAIALAAEKGVVRCASNGAIYGGPREPYAGRAQVTGLAKRGFLRFVASRFDASLVAEYHGYGGYWDEYELTDAGRALALVISA